MEPSTKKQRSAADAADPDRLPNFWGDARLLNVQEDRYGGVEVSVNDVSGVSDSHLALNHAPCNVYGVKHVDLASVCTRYPLQASAAVLEKAFADGVADWQAKKKGGVWLRVPIASAAAIPVAVAHGFEFHHAQPAYCLLTRWLPTDRPSPLPP